MKRKYKSNKGYLLAFQALDMEHVFFFDYVELSAEQLNTMGRPHQDEGLTIKTDTQLDYQIGGKVRIDGNEHIIETIKAIAKQQKNRNRRKQFVYTITTT